MEGSAKESVAATMYTPAEFRRVVDASKNSAHAEAELSSARETARAAGLRESQLLTNPAQVERRSGLGDLFRFAAVSGKGGTYNVYVKSVRVRADRQWLHQVTVADTPGTNDPNLERDRITREWIQRADAVLYVTFAGQAGMDNADVKFIDDHLSHVSPERRIIAVNMCDLVPDTEAIWRHIRKIQQSNDKPERILFGSADRIVLVSGLGALIATMQATGQALSENMRWYASEMSAKGYLDADRHGVETLRDLIERNIIAIKGEGIIRSHQERLSSVFEKTCRGLEDDDQALHYELDAADASSEERAKEIQLLSAAIREIGDHVMRTRGGISNELDRLHSRLDERLSEVSRSVMQHVEESLRGMANIERLSAQARWGIQDALYNERSRIAERIRELASGIETKLNEAENDLSDKLMHSSFGVHVARKHLLPVSARTICKDVEAQLIENLEQGVLSEVVSRATNWWQRVFNTAKGKRSGIESVRHVIGEALKDAMEAIPGYTERELKKLADEAVGAMEESCRKGLEKRQDQLEALENDDVSSEVRRKRIKIELAEKAEQRRRAKALQDEYESAVAS